MPLKDTHKQSIQEIHAFIEENPLRQFTISELAKLAGLSEDKLTKGFKELFSISIYQYKLEMSMQYAASLLRKGAAVKTVAIDLGYKSPGSFTRAFVKVFKYPPITIKNEISPQ